MSRHETLTKCLDELSQLFNNAKKKINAPYKIETIQNKRLEANGIIGVVRTIQIGDIADATYKAECLAVKDKFFEIYQELFNILGVFEAESSASLSAAATMSKFKFETALKLPTLTADGDPTTLRDFF